MVHKAFSSFASNKQHTTEFKVKIEIKLNQMNKMKSKQKKNRRKAYTDGKHSMELCTFDRQGQ